MTPGTLFLSFGQKPKNGGYAMHVTHPLNLPPREGDFVGPDGSPSCYLHREKPSTRSSGLTFWAIIVGVDVLVFFQADTFGHFRRRGRPAKGEGRRWIGRKGLSGACAPPHKGRGRGPLIASSRRARTQIAMGGAGTERSAVESPGSPFLPLSHHHYHKRET